MKRLDADHYEEHKHRRLQHKSVWLSSSPVAPTHIATPFSRDYPLYEPPQTEVPREAFSHRECALLIAFSRRAPRLLMVLYIVDDGPAVAAPRRPAVQMPDEYLPPNKILFLQNLPESVSKDQLMALFSQYASYFPLRVLHMPTRDQVPQLARSSSHCKQKGYCFRRVYGRRKCNRREGSITQL